ncbi:HBL/NHE enterotoxin family protein [Hymenobacter cheonanensis]|uniref:HBL/NHE enterotoxin family protein n=1 Tax=Hymenobacter sp. CA2-7 TaxID=3063993 RepID=UPI0027125B29|nr:HBL/NHE enterotoxin family protein [Hymenobacter sp. CA2-7]MDO7884221.1 HBL/NHE enterotoxin family protein [Hymenobacter sp. CA2-7]
MAPHQFSVANQALNPASSGTSGQLLKLNSAAQAIANQAQFPTIPAVPTLASLNTHLATAQGHANAWLNTYSGSVLDTLQGVVTFGELFTKLYNPLHAAAVALGTQSGFAPNQRLIQALQQ